MSVEPIPTITFHDLNNETVYHHLIWLISFFMMQQKQIAGFVYFISFSESEVSKFYTFYGFTCLHVSHLIPVQQSSFCNYPVD